MIIGIAGGSASGKTTLLNQLSKQFGQEQLTLVSTDNYYYPLEKQQRDAKGELNFDLPSALNEGQLVNDIQKLVNGHDVELLEYTFNNPALTPQIIIYKPAPVIIVEGLFVLHFPLLQPLLNYRVLIDAPEEVRLSRRLIRDEQERGYGKDEVCYQWNNHVKPAFDKYVFPYVNQVDLFINSHDDFENGFQQLVNFISKQLK